MSCFCNFALVGLFVGYNIEVLKSLLSVQNSGLRKINQEITLVILLCIFIMGLSFNTRAQVNTEKYRKQGISHGFYFSNAFLFGYAAGNSEYLSLKDLLRLDYVSPCFNAFLIGSFNQKKANEETIINKGFVHLRAVKPLDKVLTAEAFLQKEYNEFISLNDRNLVGAGLRIPIVNFFSADSISSWHIFTGLGVMYEQEVYNTEASDSTTLYFRSTNYISVNSKIDDKMAFNFVSYYQPYINDFSNFRIVMEAGLDFKIFKNLDFEVEFTYRYDNKPVTDVEKYDIYISNGLKLKF